MRYYDYYYSPFLHFTDEKAEVQTGDVTWPQSQKQEGAELGFESGLFGLRTYLLKKLLFLLYLQVL